MRRLVSAYYRSFYPFDSLKCVDAFASSDDSTSLRKDDILLVWGGSDISPTLYNKPVSKFTGANAELSQRDFVEWGMMQRAKELGIPIIGVCRGAQMLCALAGGHLIQHVENHAGSHHETTTVDGTIIKVNSIHHQMMYPFDVPHEMLLSVKKPLSKVHFDVDVSVDVQEEPEFVYFPEVKGFAPQFHPEMMRLESDAVQFVLNNIDGRLHVEGTGNS